MNTLFMCPVCGYDELPYAPIDHEICPSCGTEFGYDDANTSHSELRERWLHTGPQWWYREVEPPVGWDGRKQLSNLASLTVGSHIYTATQVPSLPIELGGQVREIRLSLSAQVPANTEVNLLPRSMAPAVKNAVAVLAAGSISMNVKVFGSVPAIKRTVVTLAAAL